MTRRAGLDRDSVIDAAAALIDTVGLEQLSLAALANHLGIRAPSLYNHIAGLDSLKRDLSLLGTRQLTAAAGRAVMGLAGDEAVYALADAYRAYAKAHPGLYAATIRPGDAQDNELLAAQNDLLEVVIKTLAFYQLPEDRVLHMVRGLRSVVHGFASLEMLGGFGLPLDLNESFRLTVGAFLGALHEYQRGSPAPAQVERPS